MTAKLFHGCADDNYEEQVLSRELKGHHYDKNNWDVHRPGLIHNPDEVLEQELFQSVVGRALSVVDSELVDVLKSKEGHAFDILVDHHKNGGK